VLVLSLPAVNSLSTSSFVVFIGGEGGHGLNYVNSGWPCYSAKGAGERGGGGRLRWDLEQFSIFGNRGDECFFNDGSNATNDIWSEITSSWLVGPTLALATFVGRYAFCR